MGHVPMKSIQFAPVAFCLMLGACASVPPTAPSVTAVAGDNVSNQRFIRDDADCRVNAQAVTDRAAANGELGLQRMYDGIYAQCMSQRGYHIEAPVARYYYGPGYYGPGYGPGAYTNGPAPYWGYGPYWGRGNWGYGPRW